MVLKGVNWVHNDKIKLHGLESESIVYTMIKFGQMILKEVQKSAHMVLKGINWTQYKNWVK